jgi:hypothetical protein
MVNYKLINPFINGEFNSNFSGGSPLSAATKTWNTLSKYYMNNLPRTAFTLMNTANNKLSHFSVKETINNKDVTDTQITEIPNLKITKAHLNKFRKNIDKLLNKQDGGKRKRYKDDDSDSDSDSDLYNAIKHVKKNEYRYVNQPITYWWYDPMIYYKVDKKLYVPTFVYPLAPYIALNLGGIGSAILP